MSVVDQRTTVRLVCQALAPVVAQHELVITIGDGLQVSLLALQDEEAINGVGLSDTHNEVLTSYMIQQELGNSLTIPRPISTVLISSEVDPEDPAFQKPTKAVGPFYNKPQAQRLQAEKRWSFVPDGDRYRRVVPSLLPTRIVESRPIGWLLQRNTIVICAGGGGVPVLRDKHQGLQTVDGAVIDRDRASAVLATQLRADLLVLATEADAVYLDWGTSGQRAIRSASPAALQSYDFDVDSIGPKVEAACEFAELTEQVAVIGALRDFEAMVQGDKGTSVAMDYKDLAFDP
jgi:carbamate kinase